MVISAIWSTLSGQNRGPYIRNPVYYATYLEMAALDGKVFQTAT